MRGLTSDPRLVSVSAAIDAANAGDPNEVAVRGETLPLALAHGRLAAEWVTRLAGGAPDDVPDTVAIAARAHHLRRWEVPRTSYPEGRPGYLRWRRDQKRRHADLVGELMATAGYDHDEIARVQALTRREGLGTDPETQLVEDAACLVFIETQLAEMADRFEREHLLEVIRKTARKMSPAALAAVDHIDLGPSERTLLGHALGG
ncbi:hypothetical protein BH23ACT3_BH23ACT3_07000 [soil metagenome]